MFVDEIMAIDLYTLQDTDSVYAARRLMTDKRIRHVPVVDAAGRLVGLVSQRDVLAAALSKLDQATEAERQARESATPLTEIMTRNPDTVEEKTPLREAALRMQAHKYGSLPVVRDGRLVGIITDADFVAVAINLLEQMEWGGPLEEADF